MKRFNTKIGAMTVVALAALYLIASLVTGRSAASAAPPDLRAPEAGVDVWQASALLLEKGQAAVVVDIRPSERFAQYHLPGAVSLPGADAAAVTTAAAGKSAVLLVADQDDAASALAGAMAKTAPGVKAHFLKEGVRGWYLNYELPIELFSDKAPPVGWRDAMEQVRGWLRTGKAEDADGIKAALGVLSTAAYAPSMLEGKKKPAAGGAKKKISGGCGG